MEKKKVLVTGGCGRAAAINAIAVMAGAGHLVHAPAIRVPDTEREEYELIKQKKSNLPRSERDRIVRKIENK